MARFWEGIIDECPKVLAQAAGNTTVPDVDWRRHVDAGYAELCQETWACHSTVRGQAAGAITSFNLDTMFSGTVLVDPFKTVNNSLYSTILAFHRQPGYSAAGSVYADIYPARDQAQFTHYLTANPQSLYLVDGRLMYFTATAPYVKFPVVCIGPLRVTGEEDDTYPWFATALREQGENALILLAAAKAAESIQHTAAAQLRAGADAAKQTLRAAALVLLNNPEGHNWFYPNP